MNLFIESQTFTDFAKEKIANPNEGVHSSSYSVILVWEFSGMRITVQKSYNSDSLIMRISDGTRSATHQLGDEISAPLESKALIYAANEQIEKLFSINL